MRVFCLAITHKTADVALREKLAFDRARLRRALADLRDRWPEAEFVLLSTCNRTEAYWARPLESGPDEDELREWMERFRGLQAGEARGAMFSLSGAEAARHLFAVTAGLDSMVLGEAQIVAQVKDAYAVAGEEGTARAVMNELFQGALHATKRVRSETKIALGRVSVASVAIDLVGRVFDTPADKGVLNVGAGKMNDLMLRRLRKLGAERISVANRSADAARLLAESCGAKVVPFEALADELANADIVLTSTGADEPIISARMLEKAQRRRNWRPLLVVDIAVPRDVDPAAETLENVFLYNMDDLDQVARSSLARRHDERAQAERIIDEHVEKIAANLSARDAAPVIERLYERMERIAEEELDRARRKLTEHPDADADEEILRNSLRRTIRRIIHPCVRSLRESPGAGDANIAALRELFDLDNDGGTERRDDQDSSKVKKPPCA